MERTCGIGAEFEHAARDVMRAGDPAVGFDLGGVADVEGQGACVDPGPDRVRREPWRRGVGGFEHVLDGFRHRGSPR